MNANYLDASAWVKRYFAEIGSEAVAALFDGDDAVACSRFGLVEVIAPIARKGAGDRLSDATLVSLRDRASQDSAAFTTLDVTDPLEGLMTLKLNARP